MATREPVLIFAMPTFYLYRFTMCRSHSTSFTKCVAKSVHRLTQKTVCSKSNNTWLLKADYVFISRSSWECMTNIYYHLNLKLNFPCKPIKKLILIRLVKTTMVRKGKPKWLSCYMMILLLLTRSKILKFADV